MLLCNAKIVRKCPYYHITKKKTIQIIVQTNHLAASKTNGRILLTCVMLPVLPLTHSVSTRIRSLMMLIVIRMHDDINMLLYLHKLAEELSNRSTTTTTPVVLTKNICVFFSYMNYIVQLNTSCVICRSIMMDFSYEHIPI